MLICGTSLEGEIDRTSGSSVVTAPSVMERQNGTQAGLSVSRIAQIWRDIAVRSALLRDAESQPYLQRRHHTLSSTGFATGGQAAAVSRRKVGERSIHEIIAEARDCA